MVKSKPAKPPKIHHSAHLSNKISSSSSSILLSAFSPQELKVSLFASTIIGLDTQRLRVHDTATGRLRCEHVLEKGTACNSLTWGAINKSRRDAGDKKSKKKRKRLADSEAEAGEGHQIVVLALGLNRGSVVLYSPAEAAVLGTLEGGHTGEVTGFTFVDGEEGPRGWSCGTDGKLVEWDLQNKNALRTITLPDPAIKTLHAAPPALLCASHTIYAIDVDSPGAPQKYTANTTPVHTLLTSPISMDQHFISAAESDRYINVFSASKQTQIGALVAESDVKQLALSVAGENECEVLAAVTASGLVELFSSPWQPASPTDVSLASRKTKAITRKANSKIRILRPNTSETVIVANASFQAGGELIVAWAEGGINIAFERVRWQDPEDGSLALQEVIDIVKSKSIGLGGVGSTVMMNGVKDMGKAHVDQTQTIVTSGVDTQDIGMIDAADVSDQASDEVSFDESDEEEDDAKSKQPAEEPSFYDKFQALEVSAANNPPNKAKSTAVTASSRAMKPFSGSLTTVLTQALKTDDNQLLETCLAARDQKVILSTIRRLDSIYAVKLIEKLAERIARRPGRAGTLGIWVRWIIVAHGGYLVSLPNLMSTLAGLHSTLTMRAGALPKLLQLQGRLDMLSAQLELRNNLRRGVGETGVNLDEEEEQLEEGVLYIEGKTREASDSEDDGGSDEEPEEVGMEGLQIEDATFIKGREQVGADDDEDMDDESGEEYEEGDDETDQEEEEEELLNGVSSEEEDEDEDEEDAEGYDALIDDEADETDDDDGDDSDGDEQEELDIAGDDAGDDASDDKSAPSLPSAKTGKVKKGVTRR